MQISRWIFIWTWSLCHITCNLFTVYAYSTFKFHTIWIIYSFLKHKKTAHMYFLFLARIMGYYMCKILLRRKIKLHLYVHIFLSTFFHDFLQPLIFSIPLCVFVIIWWEHEHYSIWIVPSFESQSSSSCEIFVKKVLMDEMYTYKKNDPTNVFTILLEWKGREKFIALRWGIM